VPSASPRIGSRKEGNAGLDFADYVAAIDDVAGDFSLIVIDGRAREACLERAAKRLEPGGQIVFDNSRRRRYREAIERSGLVERRLPGLTPTLPYPDQTSVLTAGG
jgi:predicted O-methyltransferase YrrM